MAFFKQKVFIQLLQHLAVPLTFENSRYPKLLRLLSTKFHTLVGTQVR